MRDDVTLWYCSECGQENVHPDDECCTQCHKMFEEDDEVIVQAAEVGGLSDRGAHLLGFNAKCHCGHEDGLHDVRAKCVVLDCQCLEFRLRTPQATEEHSRTTGCSSVGEA